VAVTSTPLARRSGGQEQFEFALGQLDLVDEVTGIMAVGQMSGHFLQAGPDLAFAALAARLQYRQ
jgi:hypothetical protein